MRSGRSLRAVISLVAALLVLLDVAAAVQQCKQLKIKVDKTVLVQDATVVLDDFQLLYSSNNNQIVWIRTSKGDVYRSNNEGETWELQTVESKMPGISATNRKIALLSAMEDERGTRRIYFVGSPSGEKDGVQKCWGTEDNGQTYQSKPMPFGIATVIPHPVYPKMALFLKIGGDLYLTRDFLATAPTKITSGVSRVRWGFPNQHPNRIFVNDNIQQLIISDDFFATSSVVMNHVSWFQLRNDDDIIVVQTNIDSKGGITSKLLLSPNAGGEWNVAEFAHDGQLERAELAWQLYDTSEDSLFVNVWRTNFWGDIYKSNSFDKDFSLSMPYHRTYDFTKFESIDGVYLAGQYDKVDPQVGPRRSDDVQTQITFNKGGKWEDLQPPAKRWDGTAYNCSLADGCSLHLHGYNSPFYSFFYSVPSAVGMMVASGNVGTKLLTSRDEVNMYFSRDAGVTWKEFANGPYVPEFGDHGSIVVLSEAEDSTTEILFTDDGGKEFVSCQFTDTPVDIQNIRVAPQWDSKQFIILAKDSATQFPLLFAVDFGEMHPVCQDDQYELWSPTDEHGHCILGERVTYRRRKEGERCWNGNKDMTEPIVSRVNCSCVQTDWECDFCFKMDKVLQRCVFDCYSDEHQVKMLPLRPVDACQDSDTHFEVNKGYRKVEDDTCDELNPASIKKPRGLVSCTKHSEVVTPTSTEWQGPSTVLIAAIILLVVGIGIGVFFVMFLRFARCREFFSRKRNVAEYHTQLEEEEEGPGSQIGEPEEEPNSSELSLPADDAEEVKV